jgi:hypothetical protein
VGGVQGHSHVACPIAGNLSYGVVSVSSNCTPESEEATSSGVALRLTALRLCALALHWLHVPQLFSNINLLEQQIVVSGNET